MDGVAQHGTFGQDLVQAQVHAHRTTILPEILSMIFQFIDQERDEKFALVCRDWLEPALDARWRSVHGPYHLFRLLAPTKLLDQSMVFERELRSSDWVRFNYYACRVRFLKISTDCCDNTRDMDESVITEVLRTCPSRYLLPRLDHLEVSHYEAPWIRQCVDLVFHDHLRHLDFRSEVHGSAEFLKHATRQGRFLETIRLDVHEKKSEYGNVLEIFCAMASQLSGLKRVGISSYLFNVHAFRALMQMPELLQLEVIVHWNYDVEAASERRVCRVPSREAKGETMAGWRSIVKQLNAVAPTKLSNITLQGRLEQFFPLFSPDVAPNVFPRLTHLRIDVLGFMLVVTIHGFLALLPGACPLLEGLLLTRNEYNGFGSLLWETERITAATLQPLCYLDRLSRLKLWHSQPVHVTNGEFVDWISNCKNLSVVELAHEPLSEMPPSMSLDVIGLVRQVRPNISLSLFVDTQSELEKFKTNPDNIPQIHGETAHTNIRPFLDFGTSPLHKED